MTGGDGGECGECDGGECEESDRWAWDNVTGGDGGGYGIV